MGKHNRAHAPKVERVQVETPIRVCETLYTTEQDGSITIDHDRMIRRPDCEGIDCGQLPKDQCQDPMLVTYVVESAELPLTTHWRNAIPILRIDHLGRREAARQIRLAAEEAAGWAVKRRPLAPAA